jgi:NAD(P)-dependent dehydrogenase (short-subunit alcohol dehydrogenase family)
MLEDAVNATPRSWLITGASSGLGKAFAREALAAGDVVIATARRPEALADLTRQFPGHVTAIALDVRDAGQCRQAVESALTSHGRIDVLVNNAGYGIVGAVEEITEEDLRDEFEVLFFGAMRLSRLVLPHMRARRSGTIIQVSSVMWLATVAGGSAYSAAKAALGQASEVLAAEVRPLGIRVLIVEPGAFRTGIYDPARLRSCAAIADYHTTVGGTRAYLAAVHGNQPGDPDKAAQAVLTALDSPNPPLRLALGEDALSAIRHKITAMSEELERNARLSRSTALAAAAHLGGRARQEGGAQPPW